ncbi:MAG: hypothetical protein LBR36_09980 [Bacteroidales bacterium]|jgi:hypothetical protein|nr:hypothetical protein [Bacteroidales bacterium]
MRDLYRQKKTNSAEKTPPKSFEQKNYEIYKQRNEIEVMFDSYKNYLKADVSYMQNRYILEGWLFANFVAMLAYYKLYVRLREAGLLSKHSPKDIIELAKSIIRLKINDIWFPAEITNKTVDLFEKNKIAPLK